ncbi:retrotransposon protein, putative, ty1-copia subclass [Tanacetum coccineum]
MVVAAQNTNNTTIRSDLLAEKLTSLNFTNWYRNLRIVLMYEKKIKFVEQPTGPAPNLETADPDTIDKYYETVNLEQEVACLLLSSMSPNLQRTLEKYNAYDMLKELKTMFEEQAKQELFEIVKALHACKQEKGQSVSSYLLKMKSYLDTLECLGYVMPNELGASLILNSLNKDCYQFVQNYNMHIIGKTIDELHAMLKLHEKGIPNKAETLVVLAIREGKIHKDKKKPRGAKGKDKVKNKLAYDHKPKISPPPKRDNSTKDSVCHHCKEGLRESKKLKHGALSLYMGNGMCAAVEAIGSFNLIIPSGLIIVLDNCHFTPSVTRGVVSSPVWSFRMKLKINSVKKIMAIRSDRGGEYLSHEFVNHMKSCGIVSQLTPPYTPQHNGVSKRRNRTLLDIVRSMMNLTTLPKSFWGYALESVARILNMVPTKMVERTPYEIWHEKAPKFSYLTNKIFVAQNVEFFENSLMVQEASGSHGLLESSESDGGLELIQEEDIQPSKNTSEIHNKVAPIEEYELGDLNEPSNYKAVLSDPEFDKWLEAMNTKMQSMKDNQVWVLVDLPPNGQTLGNYGETFSSVADIRAIRILLAIAAFYDYENCQMDVKIAFLNSHLSEDVYMVQPEGFVDPKHPNKVCKLQRSIYELKQASRSWNKRFDVKIKKIGFTQNSDEPCVYLKASGSNVAFLILYVDEECKCD